MRLSRLQKIVLSHIHKLLEETENALVREGINTNKGDILRAGNPLSDASSKNSDAKRWLEALQDEYSNN